MVASIGVVAAPSQGAGYYERDGYYARDDPAHREASAWAGKGAEDLGLSGPVDRDLFKAVLEGKAPDGSGRQLGRRGTRWGPGAPARAGSHLLRPQVRLPRRAGRRRQAYRRGP